MSKLRFGRYGLISNPIGGHCTLDYQGRTLIGTVISVERTPSGYTVLNVRRFDGSDWPLKPSAKLVEMLDRDTE